MITMKQVCEETNMTYQALKYYCNEGLIPNVKRDSNNHRDWKQNFYDEVLSGKRPYVSNLIRGEE